ncbi:conserved protein of unknown function [Petrocella atlantisensis]|uniref:Anti-sigma factor RsgI-like middle domain-containing protein n=1 Tax=Petrocella atlantisensis TaxID=2173034 RepID=A0A3P7NXF3_9FIRM|nr:hypothetical protein [Petrocella atlantisensis]VDN47645.1 conserved protein of unknown function [Petrocella atlantisensis]
MNEKKILKHLSQGIEQAPIQLLETIKEKPRVKQEKHDDITRQKKYIPPIRYMTAIASVVLLVVLFNIQLRAIDSTVYLDINPSIQIETNKQNKVIGITALNAETHTFIGDYEFKGRTLNQVTIDLVDKLILTSYITKSDDMLLVSVYNDNKEKANLQKQEIKEVIINHLAEDSIRPIVLAQAIDRSNTITDMAKAYGISEGKMTFIRNLMILSPELRVDNLARLSLEQLISMAKYMELDLSTVIEEQELERVDLPYTIIDDDIDDNDDDIDDDEDIDDDDDEDIDDDDDEDIDDDDDEDIDDDDDDDIDDDDDDDIDDDDDDDDIDDDDDDDIDDDDDDDIDDDDDDDIDDDDDDDIDDDDDDDIDDDDEDDDDID